MARFCNLSLVFSLLPLAVVLVVMALQAPRPAPLASDEDSLMLCVPPSPSTDLAHVIQLRTLRQMVAAYDRRADRQRLPRPSHAEMSAEYALIVCETTPAALARAGLSPVLR